MAVAAVVVVVVVVVSVIWYRDLATTTLREGEGERANEGNTG